MDLEEAYDYIFEERMMDLEYNKMSDISMCEGKHCPKKDNCYRFLAKPNEFWQAYFVDTPYDHKLKACEYYWPVKDPKHIKELNEALND